MACDFFHRHLVKRNPGSHYVTLCPGVWSLRCPGLKWVPDGGWTQRERWWWWWDNGQLKNNLLLGPLLCRPPSPSLIKSWGRSAPRRRRVHCAQGADEVSRGGLGGAWEREDTVYLRRWPRFPARAGLRWILVGIILDWLPPQMLPLQAPSKLPGASSWLPAYASQFCHSFTLWPWLSPIHLSKP